MLQPTYKDNKFEYS